MQMIANACALDYKAGSVNQSALERTGSHLVWLLILCFVLRVSVGGWLLEKKPDQFIGVDGAEYLDAAYNIHWGVGYAISSPRIWDWEQHYGSRYGNPKPEVFRPPLYSIALAGILTFGTPDSAVPSEPSPFAYSPTRYSPALWLVVSLNALFTTVAGWFLFDLARRALSVPTAELTLIFYIFYPLVVILGVKIGAESLFTLCLCACAWALWRAKTERPLVFSLAAGLCLGLATLTRSNGVCLWPFAAIWLFFCLRTYRLAVLWFSLLFVLTLMPWGIRNYRVTGHWIFLSASGPYNLWLGNNEVAYRMFTASSSAEYDKWGKVLLEEAVPEKVKQLSSPDIGEAQRMWNREAWKFIREHPLQWTRLLVAKTIEFWRPYVRPGFFPRSYVWLSLFTTLPLFLFGAWGLVLLFRTQPSFAWLIVAIVAAGMIGLVLSHVHVRLRVPFVDTFFTIPAAFVLVSCWERMRGSTKADAAPSA